LEAATGFEPVIEVLQTCALPLGYAATNIFIDFLEICVLNLINISDIFIFLLYKQEEKSQGRVLLPAFLL
jgi:hypothetical protein